MPRLLRRTIKPIDVEFDVDLYEVVESFYGPVRRGSLDEVIAWIEAGDVELDVVSPKHFLSEGWTDRARKLQRRIGGTGKDPHRLLCATLWLYLEEGLSLASGASGSETLGYASGVADVAALDRSLFVECGTIGPDKLSTAMRAGHPLLIAPYNLGGTLVDPAQMAKLVCSEERRDLQPQGGHTEDEERRLHYAALGCAQLGFVFKPVSKLGEDPKLTALYERRRKTVILADTEPVSVWPREFQTQMEKGAKR